jgi:hypothetical protein
MRDFSRLTRVLKKMPVSVRQALAKAGLAAAYRARPAYRQNDCPSWIRCAKLPQTKHKRLEEILEDLRRGDWTIGMAYREGKEKRGGTKELRFEIKNV